MASEQLHQQSATESLVQDHPSTEGVAVHPTATATNEAAGEEYAAGKENPVGQDGHEAGNFESYSEKVKQGAEGQLSDAAQVFNGEHRGGRGGPHRGRGRGRHGDHHEELEGQERERKDHHGHRGGRGGRGHRQGEEGGPESRLLGKDHAGGPDSHHHGPHAHEIHGERGGRGGRGHKPGHHEADVFDGEDFAAGSGRGGFGGRGMRSGRGGRGRGSGRGHHDHHEHGGELGRHETPQAPPMPQAPGPKVGEENIKEVEAAADKPSLGEELKAAAEGKETETDLGT